MTDILAVFRSRSQAIDCSNKLRVSGIPAQLINTPAEANIGCGLSIKISQNFANRAKNLISRLNYSAFYGYMKLEQRGGKYIIRKT